MYCYCENDPVNKYDSSGNAWYDAVADWWNTISGFLNLISTVTAVGSIVCAAIDGRWNNGCLNPFNQNEYIKSESEVYTKVHIIIKTKDSKFFEFIPAYQKYGDTKTYYTCVNYDLLKIMYDYGKDNNYI